MARKKQVVVIGKNNADDHDILIAYQTGKIIGESGAVLINGGGFGVMKHSSRGAKDGGGLVVSILPNSDASEFHEYSDIVIPTGIGYARNLVNVLAGDLVIAIGGGAGTLSELAYAWQFKKTIFAYTIISGWSAIIADMQRIDTRHSNKVLPIKSIEDFSDKFNQWLHNPLQFSS